MKSYIIYYLNYIINWKNYFNKNLYYKFIKIRSKFIADFQK